MYPTTSTELALVRSRQSDLLADADHARLARTARAGRARRQRRSRSVLLRLHLAPAVAR